MKLFIPACGDRITLTQPWNFLLYLEHRNTKFAEAFLDWKPGPHDSWGSYDKDQKLKNTPASLPAGSILECDRVYIRTFNKSRIHDGDDYDSITWKLIKKDKAAKNGRFWVKLHECNNIEYELAFDAVYRDRVKAVKYVMET